MCGICGFSGQGDDALLRRMAKRIAHRGPDEEGVFSDNKINLASRRLAIMDVPKGKQPMCSRDKRLCLVWNGEVYNHRELRRELEENGHTFYTSHSDTEVLLEMYREYGDTFVTHLNGMFAIALWDRQENTLFLYRDRLGVKPLYYSLSSQGTFLFASEIKAMECHPEFKREWNDGALYQYFSFKNVIAPETAYHNVFSLMPGEMMTVFLGNGEASEIAIKRKKYWQLSAYYDVNPECTNDQEKIERIGDLLKDAIRLRMEADVEVGSFLSGGLDSSLVSAIADGFTESLNTFTLGHQVSHAVAYEKEADVAFARQLARDRGMRHEVKVIGAGDVIRQMDHIVSAFDEPFSGAVSTFFMAEVVSRHVKTVLSGDGADEIFGSYLPHILAFPMEHYAAARQRKEPVDSKRLYSMSDQQAYLEALYEFSQGREDWLSYRMLLLTDEEKSLFLSERFEDCVRNQLTFRVVQRAREGLPGRDVLNRNLQYDSEILLPNQVLKYTDTLSMAHSLEVRSPYLDHRLVEYVAGISGEEKMRGGDTKHLLKKVAESYLPEEMIYRKKEGFVMPVKDWLPFELKEYVLDTLSMDALMKYDIFRPEAVYFILKKYYSAPEENEYLAESIWNFVCFQKWWEQKNSASQV